MSDMRRRKRKKRPGWKEYVTARSAYMSSQAWKARRLQWFVDERNLAGGPVTCPGCGRFLNPRFCDVHHTTYARLGHEAHDDLLAMCRACHELLHRHLDVNWRLRRWIAGAPGPNTRIYARRLRKVTNT